MGRDLFDEVPTEILDFIFSFCDARDLGRLSQLCKRFQSGIEREEIWKDRSFELFTSIFPLSKEDFEWIQKSTELSWKVLTKFLFSDKGATYQYEYFDDQLFLKKSKNNIFVPTESFYIINDGFDLRILFGEFIEDGDGFGQKITKKGENYSGEWKDWRFHGNGEIYFHEISLSEKEYLTNGGKIKYVGKFEDGNRHGKGENYFLKN